MTATREQIDAAERLALKAREELLSYFVHGDGVADQCGEVDRGIMRLAFLAREAAAATVEGAVLVRDGLAIVNDLEARLDAAATVTGNAMRELAKIRDERDKAYALLREIANDARAALSAGKVSDGE